MLNNIFEKRETEAERAARKKGKALLKKLHLLLRRYPEKKPEDIKNCIHMIESGADLSQTISGKVTALMLAAETGNTEVARCLLEHGAKPNTQDSYGFTALMYTTLITRGEFTDTALTLLEHGADASTQSNGGETALMYAILNGHERLAKILIAHNADTTPIMKTNYWGLKGKTAGEIAEKAGRTKLASTIHTEYIKSTFRAAAEQGTTRPRKVRRARPSAVR